MRKNQFIKNRRKWTKIWLTLAGVIVFAAVCALFFIRRLYYQHLEPVNGSEKTVILTVDPGASVNEIAKDLKSKGLIHSTWSFEWYVRSNDIKSKLQAGTYAFTTSLDTKEIVDVIASGKVTSDLVTILPGQRLDQIEKYLINEVGYSKDEVENALNPDNYTDSPALSDKPSSASLEGYLYPDSYQKTATTKLETIIRASLDEMDSVLTPELRLRFSKKGMNLHEAVTLGSIIDQEVSSLEDKPTVAQVFLTRITKGMSLGSDPTAFYGAYIEGQTPSVLYDSPYNTRIYVGLPPGPIGNVTKEAMNAVAYPTSTDYLFFVAGDDGVTHFSRTLEEHESLTAQYCKKLCM